MPPYTSPVAQSSPSGATLASLLAAIEGREALNLHLDYGGRRTGRGFHVTEVKAGSFVTLDCGSNPDAWQETVLQVEDIPGRPEDKPLTAGKFAAILTKVGDRVRLDGDARLTIEIGRPDEPMQVHDVAQVRVGPEGVVLDLVPRPAICKPRHRAEIAAAACCGTAATKACC